MPAVFLCDGARVGSSVKKSPRVVLLGVGSVVGDLVESLIKREAGLKDSGGFFPGVGGVLDLLDSLLFNAPLMYLFLKYGLAQ